MYLWTILSTEGFDIKSDLDFNCLIVINESTYNNLIHNCPSHISFNYLRWLIMIIINLLVLLYSIYTYS